MKLRTLATLLCAFLVIGCAEKPIRTEVTDNPSVAVDLLMQHDGCKIYRFTDSGHAHYFVKCADAKITSTDITIPNGKTTITETIHTVNDK